MGNNEPDCEPPAGPDSTVWCEKEVLRAIIEQYDAALVDQDRVPAWALVTAAAFFATAWMALSDLTPPEIFDRVRHAPELKQAVFTAYRLQASNLELMDLILNWRA